MDQPEILIRAYTPGDEKSVVELWHRCGLVTLANNPVCDIERKLKVNPELFLVGMVSGKVVATVMAGYEGHRGWINYLAVAPEQQRKGIGFRMMEEAEGRLRELGCPKINLQIRKSNSGVAEFYKRAGYSEDPAISMGKRLKDDPTSGG